MVVAQLPKTVFFVLFFGLLALPGLVIFVYGLREGVVAYRLYATNPTSIADLPNVSGTVEVAGLARTHDETIEAPLTGTPCLAYKWEVEERRQDNEGHTTWTTIASGKASIPFRVEDDTASVLVNPERAELRLTTIFTIRVDAGERPGREVQAFIEREPTVDTEYHEHSVGQFAVLFGNARRFSESRLDPDTPVYVYGRTTYAPGESREVGQVNARIEGGRPFLVADATESEATRRAIGRAMGSIIVGLLWLGGVASFWLGGVALGLPLV